MEGQRSQETNHNQRKAPDVCNLSKLHSITRPSVSNLTASHLQMDSAAGGTLWLSPPLLVEEAGEGLAADLFGEIILPPQNAVLVLLVVPLTGRDVRALGHTEDRRQSGLDQVTGRSSTSRRRCERVRTSCC